MRYWLKLIGSWDDPSDSWDEPHVEFAGINGGAQIQPGDMLVLYATRHRRLFAIAEATSLAYDHAGFVPERWGNRSVNVVYHSNRPVADGPHGGDFDPPFRSFSGGLLELTPERYQLAADALLGNNQL